jgi:hypothetical protein
LAIKPATHRAPRSPARFPAAAISRSSAMSKRRPRSSRVSHTGSPTGGLPVARPSPMNAIPLPARPSISIAPLRSFAGRQQRWQFSTSR